MMTRIFQWMMVAVALSFSPMASAAASDLQIGPGDVLKILVFDQPDLSLEVRVGESGDITFPLIGTVSVGGGTTADAERKIANQLESGGFIRNPHVNVIVSQMQSQLASVLGQVNRPGRYPLEGKRTVADVIALAAGVSADGGDIVTLIRENGNQTEKTQIDLLTAIREGDLTGNMLVQPGDILYVERAPRFYIYGEVQRPGQYRLERNMTVLQALSSGGGLSGRGTERGMKVKRLDEKGEVQILPVKPYDQLKPDDVLYVKESLF